MTFRDPHLDARAKAFLKGRPRTVQTDAGTVGQYEDRSPAKLAEDVNRLSDLLVAVIRERDLFILEVQAQKFWIQILYWVVGTEGLVIAFFAHELFSRLK